MAPVPLKLLFATRNSPFSGESGSGTYVFSLLRYLATRGFQIHVVWTESPDLNPTRGWYAPPVESQAVCSLEIRETRQIGRRFWNPDVVWLPAKARASHALKTALQTVGLWRRKKSPASQRPLSSASGAPASSQPQWGDSASPDEISCVRAAILRHRPDVVMANFSWMAATVRPQGARTPPFAVLTLDVRHRQVHLRAGRPVEILGEHCSAESEKDQLAPADSLIAIQSVEAGVFRKIFPNKLIVTAPMPVVPRPLPLPAAPAALFVGSGHGPNLAGIKWFLSHVWPLVRTDLPSARLFIAGTICSALQNEALPSGVELLGRLPDLSSAYESASVVVAPLLQGSGIKIKLLEAIGYGRACITTSVGLEGLEGLQPALRVADTPEAFAHETIALLASLPEAAAVGAETLALARTHLSVEQCFEPVSELLRTLAARSA